MKRVAKWYKINDNYGKEIKKISHLNFSNGLFKGK